MISLKLKRKFKENKNHSPEIISAITTKTTSNKTKITYFLEKQKHQKEYYIPYFL